MPLVEAVKDACNLCLPAFCFPDFIFSWIWQVSLGLECGVGMEDFIDWEVGDRIEAFNVVQKRRTLEEASASVAAALADAGLDF